VLEDVFAMFGGAWENSAAKDNLREMGCDVYER